MEKIFNPRSLACGVSIANLRRFICISCVLLYSGYVVKYMVHMLDGLQIFSSDSKY